jgi:hypothetical protein
MSLTVSLESRLTWHETAGNGGDTRRFAEHIVLGVQAA